MKKEFSPLRRMMLRTALMGGEAVVLTSMLRQMQTNTAFGLFLPDVNFLGHRSFSNQLPLGHGEKERKRVVGFGDSNMGDWRDENWPRLMNVLRERVGERGIGAWETHTFSWNGSTSTGVLQQIEANEHLLNIAHGKFDAWLNVGGNDVAGDLLTDKEKAADLLGVFESPYSEKTALVLQQFAQNIRRFGDSFDILLKKLVETYPTKLQNVVVVTMPDFSYAEALRTEEPRLTLQGSHIRETALRAAIRGAAMGINREILEGIEHFEARYPHYPILAVKIWGVSRASFREDIHYSHQGHQMIVDNVLNRIAYSTK